MRVEGGGGRTGNGRGEREIRGIRGGGVGGDQGTGGGRGTVKGEGDSVWVVNGGERQRKR